jgi:hypothetical protein
MRGNRKSALSRAELPTPAEARPEGALIFVHIVISHYKMATSSLLPKETIKIFAQAVGVDELADDVAQQLAADVEYRLREITQVLWL